MQSLLNNQSEIHDTNAKILKLVISDRTFVNLLSLNSQGKQLLNKLHKLGIERKKLQETEKKKSPVETKKEQVIYNEDSDSELDEESKNKHTELDKTSESYKFSEKLIVIDQDKFVKERKQGFNELETEDFNGYFHSITENLTRYIDYSVKAFPNFKYQGTTSIVGFVCDELYQFHGSHDGSFDKIYDTPYAELLDMLVSSVFYYYLFKFRHLNPGKLEFSDDVLDDFLNNVVVPRQNATIRETIRYSLNICDDRCLMNYFKTSTWLSIEGISSLLVNMISYLSGE